MTTGADFVELCMGQISTNMEELSFLRDLAGHMKVQPASGGVETLCAKLLPRLKESTSAEYVGFLKSEDREGERYWQALCESSRAPFANPVGETMDLLLEWLPWQNAIQGMVFNRNSLNPQLESRLSPWIRSCVAVEVRHEEASVGWLLAINKHSDALRNPGDGSVNGEQEFGTHEASLLSSVAGLLATHAQNVQLFEQKEALFLGVIRGMASALDARDKYTSGHSERVANTARCIAIEMQLPNQEIENIYISGLLHDIGKIGIPDRVLLKPARLTDQEYEIIRQHPGIGYDILKQIPAMSSVLPGVLYHHESLDGQGYPEGLKGDAIPLMARILSVADAFDAMTSTRAYRPKMALEKAFAILKNQAGIQWDAKVLDAFFEMRSQRGGELGPR